MDGIAQTGNDRMMYRAGNVPYLVLNSICFSWIVENGITHFFQRHEVYLREKR